MNQDCKGVELYWENRKFLEEVMLERFTTRSLRGISPEAFRASIEARIGSVDAEVEQYQDTTRQRDLSIKYHWGHNHDFGDFSVSGRMGDRHLDILAKLLTDYGLPRDLTGCKILDIGCWTGGTSLLLAALGAEVTALEEVRKYAATVRELADAFGVDVRCESTSLYGIEYRDTFDYVLYSGVIYHVTDPVLSLRLVFNALQDGGEMFVETFAMPAPSQVRERDATALARVEGPDVFYQGTAEGLDRGGWNYFVPTPAALERWMRTVGFDNVLMGELDHEDRLLARATRASHVDMLRAGLSRPDVP